MGGIPPEIWLSDGQTPEALRVMILNTLPDPYAEKLRPKREKYPTYQSILKHCRDKIDEKRQLMKAEVLNQPKKKIASLVQEIQEMDAAPPPTLPGTAAQGRRQPVPTNLLANPITTVEELKEMMNAVGGPRQRAHNGQSGDKAKNPFKKFWFKECFDCGKEGHSRADCPGWKRSSGPLVNRQRATKGQKIEPA